MPSIAQAVARLGRSIDALEMKLNHPDVYDSEEEFRADEQRLVELRTAPQPQGMSAACDHLTRDSEGDVHVCGTYATIYADGSTLCRAGHLSKLTETVDLPPQPS